MRSRTLIGLSTFLMITALYLVFIYVPTDVESGIIQRIFYFHVPLGWVAFLSFFIVFLCSIQYLWKRDLRWDMWASASAELGVVFTTLVLVTGSIWARPVWGVWWTWDPRLTTSLVLWLIYVAYFIIRSYVEDEERRARFAAIVGIAGFFDVPIVALAITLTRTQHPGPIVFQGGLAPSMLLTLIVCIVAFTALYFLLLTERSSLRIDEERVKRLARTVRG